jgi:hypothetical protein
MSEATNLSVSTKPDTGVVKGWSCLQGTNMGGIHDKSCQGKA